MNKTTSYLVGETLDFERKTGPAREHFVPA
jgi:hypothetical protein